MYCISVTFAQPLNIVRSICGQTNERFEIRNVKCQNFGHETCPMSMSSELFSWNHIFTYIRFPISNQLDYHAPSFNCFSRWSGEHHCFINFWEKLIRGKLYLTSNYIHFQSNSFQKTENLKRINKVFMAYKQSLNFSIHQIAPNCKIMNH